MLVTLSENHNIQTVFFLKELYVHFSRIFLMIVNLCGECKNWFPLLIFIHALDNPIL